jgi:serine/threonine protein kinase
MFKHIFNDDVSLHHGIPKCYSNFKDKEFKDWEIAPWELYIDSNDLLGEGSWAKVYLAEWRHTKVVAKVLKNQVDLHAKELIIKEFNNMTKMHHPNIVQLFGYIEEPFIIIMEYFQNGDLYSNLTKLNINQKIKIANDIIKGLIYIHERRPNHLIHRDIKLRNILLTNSYTAKIADFGLSTFNIENIIKIASNDNLETLETLETLKTFENINLDNNISSNQYTKEVGTQRYMAPEIVTGKYNELVDIYSCGILYYELFSNTIFNYKYNFNNFSESLKELINKMTKLNPKHRTKATEVFYLLKKTNFKQKRFKLLF